MIYRILRQLTVRQRVLGTFLVFLLIMALTAPLLAFERNLLIERVHQITDVESRSDRLLLLASSRVESSRVNLMRYIDDLAASAYESLDDIDLASQLLNEANDLLVLPEQREDVTAVLEGLNNYQAIVREIETKRSAGEEQEISRLMFQANRLGNDISQRIEQIADESEVRVAAANDELFASAQGRMILMLAINGGLLILALLGTILVARSITTPVIELRDGAEAIRQGQLDITVPVSGTDELSLLARAFNQMTVDLSQLYESLEERVAQRTQELERQSTFLQAAAEVGRAATSILETDVLIDQVVELIRSQFGLYYVGLFMADATREWAVLRAGTGQASQIMLDRGHRIQVGDGMIGWSIANAEARVALDAGEDAIRLATAELPDTRSEAAIPLRYRGKAIGALTVQSDQPEAFDNDIIEVLQTLADQVAVALENAQLYSESQMALDAERRAYGEISQKAWMDMAKAKLAQGYQITSQDAIVPAAEQWTPEMIQAREESHTITGGGSVIAIPIKIRDRVAGVIRLRKPDNAAEWASHEVELMETLTDHLSEALEAARLYQDSQRRAAREQLTSEVTARMRQSLDVNAVLQTAVREMREALGLHDIAIQLGNTNGVEHHQSEEVVS